MLSFKLLAALASTCEEAEPPGPPRRDRRDWVRGEVRCLMCARLVGRLLGSAYGRTGELARQDALSFFAYKSAEPDSIVVRYMPGMHLRCAKCGGAGALDDVEFFSTYDEVPGSLEYDEPLRRGPGRPPRPFKTHDQPQTVALRLGS